MARDIVVIGASAGGVEALRELVKSLPKDLPAMICVTHHFPSHSRSVLPAILERAGKLSASHAKPGDPIRMGHIYIAPPDYHLLLHPNGMDLSSGPKENGVRPAIDTMFRSAAKAFGTRVIGVILTGMLDDGASGLLVIKSMGGAAIVQDPNDAFCDSLPKAALREVRADRVVPIAQMADTLIEFVCDGGSRETNGRGNPVSEDLREEIRIPDDGPSAVRHPDEVPGTLTMLTCPECHGTLWEVKEQDLLRYRCHVGHAYTENSFLTEKGDEIEAALWGALRALREHAVILLKMEARSRERGLMKSTARFATEREEADKRAETIRSVLIRRELLHEHD